MRNLKEYRTARKGLPDLLNAAFLLEDGLLLNKDGSLTSAFYYSGPDLESCSDDDLDTLSQHINHALAQLGTDWTVQVDAIRFPAENYTKREDCFFADAATAVIDEERRQQYEAEGAHFEICGKRIVMSGALCNYTKSKSTLLWAFYPAD